MGSAITETGQSRSLCVPLAVLMFVPGQQAMLGTALLGLTWFFYLVLSGVIGFALLAAAAGWMPPRRALVWAAAHWSGLAVIGAGHTAIQGCFFVASLASIAWMGVVRS